MALPTISQSHSFPNNLPVTEYCTISWKDDARQDSGRGIVYPYEHDISKTASDMFIDMCEMSSFDRSNECWSGGWEWRYFIHKKEK